MSFFALLFHSAVRLLMLIIKAFRPHGELLDESEMVFVVNQRLGRWILRRAPKPFCP